MKTTEKLMKLRSLMASKKISAYIISSSDPHLSEYLPDCWGFRSWISGFTGSAGTLVVTLKEAALWTDSRYFLQAENELKDSNIELCKMGLPETPSMEEWIGKNLKKKEVVGFDGRLIAHGAAKKIIAEFESKGLKVKPMLSFIENIWLDRPAFPKGKAFDYELCFAGRSVTEKIDQIRKTLAKEGSNACIISALDEVAWTFNIRGNDIKYNPLVLSYGYI
jgi:Xaa-Pro aminopeptidase